MPLNKNEVHTVTITGYTSEGQGVARIDGQVVFVKGALDGENCDIRILKVEKNVAYAKIETMITPSPYRTKPACPIYGKCGGCDLMHMHYTEELRFKRQRVVDALERIGKIYAPVGQIIAAEKLDHYRNKAIFAVGQGPVTGFYRPRSHEIVSAPSCYIQAEVTGRAAAALREWMKTYDVSAYEEDCYTGLVRHLFVRQAADTGQTAVCVVVTKRKFKYQGQLVETILRHCPETASVVLCVNRHRGNTVLQGEFHTLWGQEYITDNLCGLEFQLSPRSFYQVNPDQAERLYHKAMAYAELSGWETVLDLYCGTGTITLYMARFAQTVIGAEIVEQAVSDAKDNARLNDVSNTRFIRADAANAAKRLKARGINPDVVVVDPPRKGLAPDVIDTIVDMRPERVVYVSCDPGTLARDLRLFQDKGYIIREVTPVDMFPRCAHVECVALMVSDNAELAVRRKRSVPPADR